MTSISVWLGKVAFETQLCLPSVSSLSSGVIPQCEGALWPQTVEMPSRGRGDHRAWVITIQAFGLEGKGGSGELYLQTLFFDLLEELNDYQIGNL